MDDPNESLKYLQKIRFMYPDNLLVRENIAGQQFLLDDFNSALKIMKESVKIRKDAKMLWVVWILTGEEIYKNQIINEYSKSMFNYLNKLFL
jgi:hypothetical protein